MKHTIDAATLAEGLAELREQGRKLAERAAGHRADGDQEAAEAVVNAAAAVTALADAIETGDGIGAALVNSTRAYERVTAVLAVRRG